MPVVTTVAWKVSLHPNCRKEWGQGNLAPLFMSIITNDSSVLTIVQDQSKFKWAGVKLRDRYDKNARWNDEELLRQLRNIDPNLDLKIYMPTLRWHLVRYTNGFLGGLFTRVWELTDDPETGMRKTPGSWMIDLLRRNDTHGENQRFMENIDEHNERVQEKIDAEQEDIAREMAKEMLKPLARLADFGPDSDYKEFW